MASSAETYSTNNRSSDAEPATSRACLLEVTYKEIDPGRAGRQELTIHTPGAFEAIGDAAEAFGLEWLAEVVRSRANMAKSGKPVEGFNPSVFEEQGAVAVHRVIDDGARQHEGRFEYPDEPRLPEYITAKMFALSKTIAPRFVNPTDLDGEMAKLPPRDTVTTNTADVVDQGTGWSDEAYKAFHDTDPRTIAAKVLAAV